MRRLRLAPAGPGAAPFALGGAHDGLSARLVEEAGFDGVWASGLEITASHGVPDRSILPRESVLERVVEMARAVSIPIVADVDAGFGDAREAGRTARLFADAGARAIVIEDQQHPKVNSFADGGHILESVPRFCDKVAAAAAARPELTVVARVESLVVGESVETALERAHAYTVAGAHAVIFHGRSTDGEDVLSALRVWRDAPPAGVIPTTYYRVGRRELGRAGASFVIYANHGLRAAIRAMQQVFATIVADGGTARVEESIAPLREVFRLQEPAIAAVPPPLRAKR